MLSTRNIWLTLVAVGIIAIIVLWGTSGSSSQPAGAVSACNGGNCTNYSAVDSQAGYWLNGTQYISSVFATLGTLTQGGGINATTTNGNTVLTASDFDTENVISMTPIVASMTATLPASSTLSSFLPTAGQSRTVFLRNASTTAGITITVAGGSGTLLRVASTTSAAATPKVIPASGTGKIDFFRKTDTDIEADLTVFAQ